MDIRTGPATNALTVLAAHPAPVVTPPLDEPVKGEPIAIPPSELAEALGVGARSVWNDARDEQVERGIKLALGLLKSRPGGVGAVLFAAQMAGIVTALAATRTENEELLRYAERLREGSAAVSSVLGGNYAPLATTGAKALMAFAEDPEPVLRPAVLGAADALAKLPPEPRA